MKRYDFDFDEWAELAKRDPHAFEARRQEVLLAQIEAMPDSQLGSKERLKKDLLSPADPSVPPMERAVKAFNLMHSSMLSMVDQHTKLLSLVAKATSPASATPSTSLSATQRYIRFEANKEAR